MTNKDEDPVNGMRWDAMAFEDGNEQLVGDEECCRRRPSVPKITLNSRLQYLTKDGAYVEVLKGLNIAGDTGMRKVLLVGGSRRISIQKVKRETCRAE